MSWGMLSDDFYDNPKVAELLEEPDGWAALGFWTANWSWAHRYTRKPGKIPGRLPRASVMAFDRANAARFAGLLVKVGLWELVEGGWQIHDFDDYLPSAKKRAAQSANAQKRWSKTAVDASGIPHDPSGMPGDASQMPRFETLASQDDSTDRDGIGSSKELEVADSPVTASVMRLCSRLADAIESNGSKRPAVGQGWRDAARLMITRDGRSEEQIARAIDFCQGDEFWRSNILSMPKLRDKYDQLRLAAQRNGRGARAATTDDRVQQALNLLDQ